MAQVFTPHFTLHVIASNPHPKQTEYRVGRGYEQWNTQVSIRKTQMVYQGKVAGKVVPSFPENTLDVVAVNYAMDLLSKGWGVYAKNKRNVVIVKKINPKQTEDELSELAQDEVFDFYSDLYPNQVVDVMQRNSERLNDDLVAFVFDVNIGFNTP
ncbi:hypothetical protein BSK65_10645 [Paenibacillus odorifer]|uniref:Uncharacterized protein n=1 Tax=Paenibacillus odorifer TaxID=189426 RepID=A0A1R0ZJX1_9BACL|nr:hypothetical protein [Paenibacillus odorifer]OME71490.1 hypothetical protein BSK65_10645 [Paenibacillus odorifer]